MTHCFTCTCLISKLAIQKVGPALKTKRLSLKFLNFLESSVILDCLRKTFKVRKDEPFVGGVLSHYGMDGFRYIPPVERDTDDAP